MIHTSWTKAQASSRLFHPLSCGLRFLRRITLSLRCMLRPRFGGRHRRLGLAAARTHARTPPCRCTGRTRGLRLAAAQDGTLRTPPCRCTRCTRGLRLAAAHDALEDAALPLHTMHSRTPPCRCTRCTRGLRLAAAQGALEDSAFAQDALEDSALLLHTMQLQESALPLHRTHSLT